MPTALDLRAERARIWEGNKELLDKAESENRNLTAEEQQEWDRREQDVRDYTERIERQEQAEERERQLAADPSFRGGAPSDPATNTGGGDPDRYERAFWNWAKRGMTRIGEDEQRLLEERQVELDERAQGTTPDSAGGYLVPEGFVTQIQEAMKAFGGVREFADAMPTSTGNDIPWPKLDDTSNKGERIDENAAHNDGDMTFGSVTLKSFTYSSKIVRVSRQLLQDDATNIESRLPQWLARRIARITNEEFTTGTGSDQPQGVVTASAKGHDASAADAIGYADFINLIHSVDPAYRANAQWMFNDQFLKAAKLLVDDQKRPLWVPGVAVREPDTLAGYRYIINQDMAAPGPENISAVFGDGSYYKVRDVLDFTLLRLEERYAERLQVGFIGFSRHDGRAVFEGDAPFKHLLHPAS